jgi:RimJ/RimL family protein N-acetyltransferase
VQIQDTSAGDSWWLSELPGTWSFDVLIGEVDHLRKGLGIQIVQTIKSLLFTNVSIRRIICDPHPDNIAAIRCYEKAGFKQIGLRVVHGGEVLLMAIANIK